jgi:hypothetical protein
VNAGGGASRPPDPELDELFGSDAELLRLAHLVRQSRPQPALDPRFQAVLRARLMREASIALAPRRLPFRRRGLRLAAWGTFAVGAAAAAAAVALVSIHPTAPPPTGAVAVLTSNVSHEAQVDPHQVITLSFSQPMDTHDTAELEQQLKIQPATAFTVAWESPTTLVVKPIHPLAANTDYSVILPKQAVQSQTGRTLEEPVTITFGTSGTPAPSPTAAPPPSLPAVVVGPADSGGVAFWGGSSPGVTSTTAGQPSPAPSPTSTALPTAAASQEAASGGASPSPSPTATPSPGASPSGAPAPARGAALFPGGATPLALSHLPASAVALSPNGFSLALSIPSPGGGSRIVVEDANSADPAATAQQVWPSDAAAGAQVSALTWQSNSYQIVFVTPQGIQTVTLNRAARSLYTFPPGGSATGVVLAPGGRYAFVPAADVQPQGPSATASPAAGRSATPSSGTASASPGSSPSASGPAAGSGDGWLLDLSAGSGAEAVSTRLPGSAPGVVAFSGDATRAVWAVEDAQGAHLVEVLTASPSAPPVAIAGPSVPGISALAVSPDGAEVAYSLTPGGIAVAATATGALIGTTPDEASSLAFSPDGDELAYVSGGSLETAAVSSRPSTPPSPCAGADQVLSEFVAAQVADQPSRMQDLSVSGVAAAASTPAGLSRGYVISAGCAPAAAQGQATTLTASARLIVDPSGSTTGQLTDETVALSDAGGTWLVSALTVPALHAQGAGPAVLSVSSTPPSPDTAIPESLVTVTFDSDLSWPQGATDLVWLQTADGAPITLASPPAYDPDTRQVTLTVSGALPSGAQLVVSSRVTDIDGGHPLAQTTYPVGA